MLMKSLATLLVAAVLAVAALVVVTSSTSSPHCVSASRALSLKAAAEKAVAALPPSHDNDAGRARIPDATPDADLDAGRRLPSVC
ncbi:MAG: hypothetical protein KGI14_07935 [Acidobacteriota bacterium]|nr:hypothetical protein [Acidobacteriota bacterium]